MSGIPVILFRALPAVLCAVILAGCSSGPPSPSKLELQRYGPSAPSGVEDTVATPPHSMSQRDYPFDSQGRYREDWATGGSRSSASPRSVARSSSGSSSARSAGGRTHLVKTGDTMFSLSRRYGVTLYALKKANGLKSYTIRRGQVLRIPDRN